MFKTCLKHTVAHFMDPHCMDLMMTMTMTMITDLLNIIVAMNCYECTKALHAI